MPRIRWYIAPLVAHPGEQTRMVPHPAVRSEGRCTSTALGSDRCLARVVCEDARHLQIAAAAGITRLARASLTSDLPPGVRLILRRVENDLSGTCDAVIDRVLQRRGVVRSRLARRYTVNGAEVDERQLTED